MYYNRKNNLNEQTTRDNNNSQPQQKFTKITVQYIRKHITRSYSKKYVFYLPHHITTIELQQFGIQPNNQIIDF